MPFPKTLRLTAICIALLAGCDGATDSEMTQPDGLSSVSGDGQSGSPGQALRNPLRVLVTKDGAPMPGQSVSWVVTSGGGSVGAATSTTSADGQASTTWTLGPSQGGNSVEASAAGLAGSPVVFRATGVVSAPPPSAVAVSGRDFLFDPSNARLAVGGTVTWTWDGSVGHNVTFNTGTSSATQSSGTFARTFSTTGSFAYRCTIHAQMTGTIAVE